MGDERSGRNPLDELRQVLGSPYGIDDFTDVPAAACWPAIPSADAAAEWARHVDADQGHCKVLLNAALPGLM